MIHPQGRATDHAQTGLSLPQKDSNSPSEQTKAVTSIRAEFLDGKWVVNGKNMPVLGTRMDQLNFIEIQNLSANKPLFIVIPKLEYQLIAKNRIRLNEIKKIDQESAGKTLLWIEPKSNLTLSFFNDLANTPLQAIVSITKNSKEIIAVFGPDQTGGFKIPTVTPKVEKETITYAELGIKELQKPAYHSDPIILDIDNVQGNLEKNTAYIIKTSTNVKHIVFDDFVYIERRNEIPGGFGYWSKEFSILPGETLLIFTNKKSSFRSDYD